MDFDFSKNVEENTNISQSNILVFLQFYFTAAKDNLREILNEKTINDNTEATKITSSLNFWLNFSLNFKDPSFVNFLLIDTDYERTKFIKEKIKEIVLIIVNFLFNNLHCKEASDKLLKKNYFKLFELIFKFKDAIENIYNSDLAKEIFLISDESSESFISKKKNIRSKKYEIINTDLDKSNDKNKTEEEIINNEIGENNDNQLNNNNQINNINELNNNFQVNNSNQINIENNNNKENNEIKENSENNEEIIKPKPIYPTQNDNFNNTVPNTIINNTVNNNTNNINYNNNLNVTNNFNNINNINTIEEEDNTENNIINDQENSSANNIISHNNHTNYIFHDIKEPNLDYEKIIYLFNNFCYLFNFDIVSFKTVFFEKVGYAFLKYDGEFLWADNFSKSVLFENEKIEGVNLFNIMTDFSKYILSKKHGNKFFSFKDEFRTFTYTIGGGKEEENNKKENLFDNLSSIKTLVSRASPVLLQSQGNTIASILLETKFSPFRQNFDYLYFKRSL